LGRGRKSAERTRPKEGERKKFPQGATGGAALGNLQHEGRLPTTQGGKEGAARKGKRKVQKSPKGKGQSRVKGGKIEKGGKGLPLSVTTRTERKQ